MKLAGAELANTLGNLVERNAFQDNNTGFSPLAAAVTAPTQKPVPGFNLN